jgi:molecular chaperone DnaJ
MAEAERDYYEVLGIPRDADVKAIKNAFRKLAMKYHPDRNKSADAETRFKEIAKAYAVLSDPNKRKRYDARGFSGVEHFTHEDLYGGIDLGDLFGDMGFGGMGGGGIFDQLFGRRPRGPNPGRDIEVQVFVDLDVINEGGQQTIVLNHPSVCDACHGTGAQAGTSPRICDGCGGTGQKVVSRKGHRDQSNIVFQHIQVCPDCGGSGRIIDKPCKQCHGKGQVDKKESLKITIPRGADEGMALRISGHGLPADTPGAPPGHLYVIVRSRPDHRFQRRGADLWRTETISIEDAVLGTEIELAALEKKLRLKIPPGTQPDEILRLRGKGLHYFQSESRGDLKVRIEIAIPRQLSDEQRELYEQLRKLNRKRQSSWHW